MRLFHRVSEARPTRQFVYDHLGGRSPTCFFGREQSSRNVRPGSEKLVGAIDPGASPRVRREVVGHERHVHGITVDDPMRCVLRPGSHLSGREIKDFRQPIELVPVRDVFLARSGEDVFE